MSKNPRNITRHVEVEIHPSADELADAFWAMDAEEQAHFFNRLGVISDGKLPFQLQQVTDHPLLDDQGRYAMSLIGDYSVVVHTGGLGVCVDIESGEVKWIGQGSTPDEACEAALAELEKRNG